MPSNWTQIATVGLISFFSGLYFSRFVNTTTPKPKKLRKIELTSSEDSYDYVDDEDLDSDEESIDINSTPLNSIPGEVRMTLIIRKDLKMGKGKAAAQCLHATLALYEKMTDEKSDAYNPEMINRWKYGNGQAKITLQVPDQESMDMMFAQAMSLNINAYIVHDAGRTQIAAGSATVLGLGPAPKVVIDQITQDLQLY